VRYNNMSCFVVSECLNLTCVRGTYNRYKCRCICPRGYWGVRCESKYAHCDI